MTITFSKPITVGDLSHQIQVTSMDVITISFNLAPASGNGNMMVSITLRDSVSGYQAHFVYEDNTVTPQFWSQVSGLTVNSDKWISVFLKRLIADGKLPSGTIS